MNLNKSFAEILKQKITIGNTRSILLNALPGRLATRLPLSDMEVIDDGLSIQFINNLVSKNSFEVKFSIDFNEKDDEVIKQLAKIQKRLSAIKYEHDDYLKEHGVETFGFGFPLFVRKSAKDPSKFIVAPLLIFQLEIKQTFDKVRQWVISRNADCEIRLNEVFISFMENEEHIKIPPIPEEMLDDGVLDKEEIESFCEALISKFTNGKKTMPLWDKLDSIPEKLTVSDPILKQTNILWNGVFGLYKTQKQSQINEMEGLLENYEEISERNFEFKWDDTHSPVITDPSQNFALRALVDNRDLVIQGPPGTGKSQTLTAIIASALANNKKLLIVCEKRTALEVLKNNLEKLIPELSDSIALIEDVSRDRTRIVEIVRNRTARFLVTNHLKTLLKEDITRFENKAQFLDKQYQSLRNPIWRNLKWKDLVSLWISTEKTDDEITLYYTLQKIFQENNTNDTEYRSLLFKIEDISIIFDKVKANHQTYESLLNCPSQINNGYEREIIFTLKEAIANLEKIQSEFLLIKNNYLNFSNDENQKIVKKCQQDLNELIFLSDKWNTKNINVLHPPAFIRLKAIFSSKYRTALNESKIAKNLSRAIESCFVVFPNTKVPVHGLAEKKSFIENNAYNLLNDISKRKLESSLEKNNSEGFDRHKFSNLLNELSAVENKLNQYINVGKLSDSKIFLRIEEDLNIVKIS